MSKAAACLAVAIAAFVGATPVDAVCGNARLFQSGYSIVQTPGYVPTYGSSSSVSLELTGSFWSLGNGDPAFGPGADNGTFEAIAAGPYGYYAGWLPVPVFYGYPATIISHWAADAGIDNCIDATGPGGSCRDGGCCMAMLLSDEDSQGIGYFALLTTPSDSFSNYDFEQAGAAPIELAQIPRPSIVGSVSTGPATGVELVVRVSDVEQTPQHGFFLDPDCGAGSPVLYRVRKQQLPEGSVPPQSRDVGEWQDTGQIVEAGADAHVMISCASDEDEYLAVSVVTDSGFETQVVGPNSGRIECGPNLADPRPRRRQRARPSRTE